MARIFVGSTTPAHKTSTALTADGAVVGPTASGFIVGYSFFGATSGDTVDIHDGTSTAGPLLISTKMGVSLTEAFWLQKEDWIHYKNALYANITVAASGRVVIYYRDIVEP